ncbi:hypothetical protein [Streptomyces sp. NBC_01180]|uniref:hypothetical protein n=1 Tax=Streptomyces sp. NBC_01180 TaxID=2903763 RepID=UPI00386435F5|nr:hypothetical protein OG708_17825 [Streptomyces sp. NBC_01180]
MLPDSLPAVTVTGRYLTPDGDPLTGQVVFRAPTLLTFAESDVILGGPVAVPLDATGAFSVTLVATDAPNMVPSDWSYTVTEQLAGVAANRAYQVLLPSAFPTVDIADLAPTDPTTPQYVAVRGDSAYEVAVEAGFTGTVTEWLLSLIGAQGPKGATGPKGDTGGTGAAGAKGATGATGATGPKGDTGPTGAPGLAGSQIYTFPDGSGIDAAGVIGDFALRTDTGRVYIKTAAGWNFRGALTGPQGIQGPQGPKGDPGTGSVSTVNGDPGPAVVLTAASVSAIPTTAKGAAGGVAALGSDGLVPAAQLPAPSGARNVWTPQALGFQAWSCDPYTVANPVAKYLTPGRVYLTGFNITEPTTVNRAVIFARGYGGVSADRFMAGIYQENGTRVVASASVALSMAGQETGSLPSMQSSHIGAVPLTLTSTTLQPGRYWVAWIQTNGGASDFAFYHVQNEAPVATANFWMPGTPFARAWYLDGQSGLPTTVSQTAAGALANHDIPILALAKV